MTLLDKSLKVGSKVRVAGFEDRSVFRERLHEMGIRVGTDLKILGRIPFGGPLLVRFHTSFFALRSEEAACTQVTLLK
jgi:ferrous iron transport protein A